MKPQLLFPPDVDNSVCWILSVGHIRAGFHLQLGWCLLLREKIIAIAKPSDMGPLLPLLELGRPQLYDHLFHVEQALPEFESLMSAFPENLLLRCAFETSVSDYWPRKALAWLELIPDHLEYCRQSLILLAQRPGMTQALRQKIRAILHKDQR